jgi:hypothetical protein
MRRGDEDVARKLAKALVLGLGTGMIAAFVIGAPGVVVLMAGGGVGIVAVAMRLTIVLVAAALHRLSGPTVTDAILEAAATSLGRRRGGPRIQRRTAGPASALPRV